MFRSPYDLTTSGPPDEHGLSLLLQQLIPGRSPEHMLLPAPNNSSQESAWGLGVLEMVVTGRVLGVLGVPVPKNWDFGAHRGELTD